MTVSLFDFARKRAREYVRLEVRKDVKTESRSVADMLVVILEKNLGGLTNETTLKSGGFTMADHLVRWDVKYSLSEEKIGGAETASSPIPLSEEGVKVLKKLKMAATHTQAFVIKTQDYRDTSLLGTFYSQDLGKFRAIVKGGRDGRARYGSTLEPFSLNELAVYKRKHGDLHMVTGAELIERYDSVRRDLQSLGLATYMAELLDQLTDIGGPHFELF
ncbi:MAG: DNA repair protein RecO, partial [Nitrosopumilus sp.]